MDVGKLFQGTNSRFFQVVAKRIFPGVGQQW